MHILVFVKASEIPDGASWLDYKIPVCKSRSLILLLAEYRTRLVMGQDLNLFFCAITFLKHLV